MRDMDEKNKCDVQLMDAGTAMFSMDGGFGTALGQVRAELREYGRVYDEGEFIMLDFSTVWRKRMIACRLEDAGEGDGGKRKYALVLKEGSGNTGLRTWTHLLAALLFAAAMAVPHLIFPELANFVLSLVCTAGIVAAAYGWTCPSKASVRTVQKLKKKFASPGLAG